MISSWTRPTTSSGSPHTIRPSTIASTRRSASTVSRSTPRLAASAARAWRRPRRGSRRRPASTSGVTVMSLRSRPRSSRWPCSASSLRGRSSNVDVVFSSWAYWAARRNVFFSPCPPIMIGISPLIGAGELNASLTLKCVPAYVVAGWVNIPRQISRASIEELVAHLQRRELEAERLVLELEPRGADAEHRPPAGDHVEGGDGLGEVRRVAVGHAGDERAEADPSRCGRRARRAACRPRTSPAAAGPSSGSW